MKTLLLLALAALPFGPASAQSAGTPQPIFSCMVGKKAVSVSSVGNQLIYRFGTLAKPEMSIIGDARSGNVLWMTQRYAGIEQQLRFKNGEYSYALYSMEGNGRTGVNPVSGLVVFHGTKSIADIPCLKYTEFTGDFDFSTLPEDSDTYTAM
jgi:hypothetical protein